MLAEMEVEAEWSDLKNSPKTLAPKIGSSVTYTDT